MFYAVSYKCKLFSENAIFSCIAQIVPTYSMSKITLDTVNMLMQQTYVYSSIT